MRSLEDILESLPGLEQSLEMACAWLTDVAQIRTDELPGEGYKHAFHKPSWKGAFFGEYSAAQQHWDFFCPIWHGGQAVKALTQAYRLTGNDRLLEASQLGAEFILNNQIQSGDDAGMIYAFEDHHDKINTSAILETLDGLFALDRVSSGNVYRDAGMAAAKWCRDRAWVKGEGIVLDLYDPQEKLFLDPAYPTISKFAGRPLADDAIWLTCFQLTDDVLYRQAFYDVLECLLRTEQPSGNWVNYGPCLREEGYIHPRHAYWWGRPMIAAWRDSGEERFLDAARRSAQWYVQAQRIDGGLFRSTNLEFKTASFGHATSGIVCAAAFWIELFQATGETCWLEPIQNALQFAMSLQFVEPKDPSLKGCILEKVLPPDGTDASPYHIRDLGTTFFIQAVSELLAAVRRQDLKIAT